MPGELKQDTIFPRGVYSDSFLKSSCPLSTDNLSQEFGAFLRGDRHAKHIGLVAITSREDTQLVHIRGGVSPRKFQATEKYPFSFMATQKYQLILYFDT